MEPSLVLLVLLVVVGMYYAYVWCRYTENEFKLTDLIPFGALFTDSEDRIIKKLLKKIPSYSYRMCYNGTGELYNPDGGTNDIFNSKKELIQLLKREIYG